MQLLGHDNAREERHLFTAASKTSVRGVLLHTGNEFPSAPVFYATLMRGT